MTNSELPNWDAAREIAEGVLALGSSIGFVDLNGWSDWMQERLTHRLADVIHQEGKPQAGMHYLIPLGDHVPVPDTDDQRTCDRCGHFTPWDAPDGEFYVLRIAVLGNVTVWGGLCAPCMALEAPQGVRNAEAH